MDKEKEFLIIENIDNKFQLSGGRFDLLIEVSYKAWLHQEYSNGFYETFYMDESNVKHYVAGTQFQPARARKAFPCFDEPHLKAQFEFRIHYKYSNYHALFNTKVDKTLSSDGINFVSHYDVTMKMSTYLLAWAITDYEIDLVSARSPGTNTLVRVPGPTHVLTAGRGDYGLEQAMSVIDGFSQYYDYNYAYSFNDGRAKSDQIGLGGKVERWKTGA